MILRCLCHGVLAAALLLSAAPARAEEVEVVPFDAVWDWLMILDSGSLMQMDPVTQDPDFLETWTTSAYNGPPFQRGAAPLSYGVLDFLMNGTALPGTPLSTPAPGSRGTVYFRTAFDLAGDLTNAKLEFLIDDGFILYVDGVQWVSWNMPPGATSAFTQASSIVGNESALSSTTTGTDGTSALPALSRGHHTLHLSVHNANSVSSDLGFMLRLTGDLSRVFDPTLTAEAAPASIDGSPRFKLRAQNLNPAAAAVVQQSTDLSHWTQLFASPPSPERSEFTLDLPAIDDRRYFRLAQ
jgi:hypothetical protein